MSAALRVRSLFAPELFVSLGILCCLLMGVPAFAQTETATISGVIQDPKGVVVPDAEVTATRIETGIAATTKTNGAGIYFFTNLMPGHYHLQISKPGFKAIAIKEFELHVQDKLEQNFSLEIGSVSEVVTVKGDSVGINTTDGTVSTVIDRTFVENLPMNGRSFNTLLQLTPGAVIATQNSNLGELGQFSINGQRTDANYFAIDGVGANFGTNTFGGGQGMGGVVPAFNAVGGTSSLVSVDAMQEFRIQTSSFAPEYGHQPGGQVAIETRSGTNEFHGNAFDYFRNTVLDANNWFNNAAGKPRAPENQNDFGGVLGGPVIIPGLYNGHDKTFLFASYEGLRLRQPQTQDTTVPTLALRASAIPAAQPYLNAYPKPDPTAPDLGNGTANFTGSWSNKITSDAGSIRVDHRIATNWNLFARFNEAPSQIQSRGGSGGSLNELDVTSVDTRTITIGLNGLFAPGLTNSFRANYSRQEARTTSSLDSFGGATPPPSLSLIPSPLTPSGAAGLFSLSDVGLYTDGYRGRTKSTQLNVLDGFSFNLGAHQLKFGVDQRTLWMNRQATQGDLQYLASTAQGFATNATADQGVLNSVFAPARLIAQSLGLYGQDMWKISSRLTLTYGLRWELAPAPSGLGSTTLPSWENVNDPSKTVLAPAGTPSWKTTFRNLAPRLGIAYSVTPSGQLVVRGGVGIYYDTGVGSLGYLLLGFPASASISIPSASLPLASLNGLTPSTSLQPPYQGSFMIAITPDLQLPRSYQWNVSLEKALAGDQSLSVSYVGQAGRRLLRSEYNFLLSNPNFRPFSLFGLTSNGDTSDYDALQLQYRRALAKGLQVLGNYTWSHSIDTSSSNVSFGGTNQIVSAGANRGSSSFDVRHNVTGALTYDVPGVPGLNLMRALTRGWSFSLIGQVRTGFPIDVQTSQLSALFYLGVSRPDVVPGKPVWIQDSTKPGGKRLNPAAFAAPTTPRQGNLARNSIQGFGVSQFDLSAARQFSFTERWRLQLRGDMFNLLNHPNFANPVSFLSSPQFGISTQTLNQGLGGLTALYQVGGPRSVQLSLKLLF
jgi:hypothetical protein